MAREGQRPTAKVVAKAQKGGQRGVRQPPRVPDDTWPLHCEDRGQRVRGSAHNPASTTREHHPPAHLPGRRERGRAALPVTGIHVGPHRAHRPHRGATFPPRRCDASARAPAAAAARAAACALGGPVAGPVAGPALSRPAGRHDPVPSALAGLGRRPRRAPCSFDVGACPPPAPAPGPGTSGTPGSGAGSSAGSGGRLGSEEGADDVGLAAVGRRVKSGPALGVARLHVHHAPRQSPPEHRRALREGWRGTRFGASAERHVGGKGAPSCTQGLCLVLGTCTA